MKKLLTTILLFSVLTVSACWFTEANFNATYIAGVNNYEPHYEHTDELGEAVYRNNQTVSLPLTVFVKIGKLIYDGDIVGSPIQRAVLQYKVKQAGAWGEWNTVKDIENISFDMDYDHPVMLFGKYNINPPGLVSGDHILIRYYLSDGVFENGDLGSDIDGDAVIDNVTSENGSYDNGWTAPAVFKVQWNGKYRIR